MKSRILLLLILIAFVSFQSKATSYLCEPVEATTVIQSTNNQHDAGRMQVDTRFILFQQEQNWVVKEETSPDIMFDQCNDSGHLCEVRQGYLGSFVRHENNLFAIYMMWDTDNEVNDSDIQYIVYAGKCIEKQIKQK
jgi:hypothetical protein